MRITWNGTGGAWSRRWGNSSALVEAEGHRLLIDCGHTVPARLEEGRWSLREVEAVFISHLHGDHVYGLEEWGFRNFLLWRARPALFLAAELVKPLWEQVLAGTMRQVAGRALGLADYFVVMPLEVGAPRDFGPWRLEIRPVRHIPNAPAFGVKVSAGDWAAGFTADSLADGDPWFYEGTERVFHDCSFRPYFPETAHAHFEQLGEYPEPWRQRTFLVHYEDDVEERRQDAEWQAALERSGMRLARPFEAIPGN